MARSKVTLAGLALFLAVAFAYAPVVQYGFVFLDDPTYVTGEVMVLHGLRPAALLWAAASSHGANWHPLTSISHMADVSLFGLHAGAHHAVNVFLHGVNAVLVFLVGRRCWPGSGGWPWAALWVAGLFALHPVNVESVAWVAERKNVLSTGFWLLGLLAYMRYVECPGRWRYGCVAGCLAAGLLAKPMLVTFPMTLLLLDGWPLRRWPAHSWGWLLREKIPLFLLVAASSVVTMLVQHAHRAMEFGVGLPLGDRVGNALVSYVRYGKAMLWPDLLVPYQPHPGEWPWWVIAGAVLVLVAGTWLGWCVRSRWPGMLVGWLWYLGTLVPVIGLVQVGSQAMADRYLYVPMLGLAAVVAIAASACCGRWRWMVRVVAPLGVLVLAACLVRTRQQLPIWRDGVALAEYIHRHAEGRPAAYQLLAQAYAHSGRPESQIAAVYREALARFPDDPVILSAMGVHASLAGRTEEGLWLLQHALEGRPDDRLIHANFGNTLLMAGKLREAETQFRELLKTSPNNVTAHFRLAQIDFLEGRIEEAAQGYRRAIEANRWDWVAWAELGSVQAEMGRFSDALSAYERAQWINPGDGRTNQKLEALRRRLGGQGAR